VVHLINRIEAYGCVVKDIDLGLLDFPSIREAADLLVLESGRRPAHALARH